jgi:hypothetical protein
VLAVTLANNRVNPGRFPSIPDLPSSSQETPDTGFASSLVFRAATSSFCQLPMEAAPALKGWATVGRRYATNGYVGRSGTGTDSVLARVAPWIGTALLSVSEAEPSPTARR